MSSRSPLAQLGVRGITAIALIVGVVAVVPASASASKIKDVGTLIRYTAKLGEANNLTIAPNASNFRFTENGGIPMTVIEGCTSVAPGNIADCPQAGLAKIKIGLKNGSDVLDASALPAPVLVNVKGGGDNDDLTGGGGDDRIGGGTKDDRIVGGPGHDILLGAGGGDNIQAVDGQIDTIDCGGNPPAPVDSATVDKSDATVPGSVDDLAPTGIPVWTAQGMIDSHCENVIPQTVTPPDCTVDPTQAHCLPPVCTSNCGPTTTTTTTVVQQGGGTTNTGVTIQNSADNLCNAGATAVGKRTKLKKRRFSIRLKAPKNARGVCKGKMRVDAELKRASKAAKPRLRIGSASFSLKPGQTKTFKVKATKRGRKLIKKQRRVRVRVNVFTYRKTGNVTTSKITKKRFVIRVGRRK